MTDVVFTGRCVVNGVHITRDELCDIAQRAGHRIHDKVDFHVTSLVASRTDTSKATKARDIGCTVINYERYLRQAIADMISRGREIPTIVADAIPEMDALPPTQTNPLDAIIRNMDGTYRYNGVVYNTHLEATQAVGRANREREGLGRTAGVDGVVSTGEIVWTPAMDSRTRAPLPDAVRAASSPNRTPVHHVKVRFFNGEERWIEDVEMLARLRIIDPSLQVVGGTAAHGPLVNAAPAPEPVKPFDMAPARRAIILDDQ